MSLTVDLSSLKSNKDIKVDSLKIGEYVITQENQTNHLVVVKNDLVIAEHTGNDWLLNGKSLNAIWQTLENHYEVLKNLIEGEK